MKAFILLLSLFLFTACNTQSKGDIKHPSEAYKTLDTNKNLWEKSNIQNYSFVIRKSCFCPPEEKKQITVQNSTIIEAKYIPSNNIVNNNEKIEKIEDYFALIQDALDRHADKLTVTYDKIYGFPSEISIDYIQEVEDDGIYYTLTHFHPYINNDLACTEQYVPICASIEIQCITTPCEAIEETFSNNCELNANPNATYLRDGEC